MVACERGYLCEVCGADVEALVDSDLYLRFIAGEVPPEALPTLPERHIRCNPAVAQYIVDPAFVPVVCSGPFAKSELPADYVAGQELLYTRAWRRLQEVATLGIAWSEFPLPEVKARWAKH